MSINITNKEYQSLIDLVAIASWIMDAYTIGEGQYPNHRELIKKIYSSFKLMQSEGKIEFAPEFNDYFETRNFEEFIQNEFIQPYEENFFWDELVYKLAERDVTASIELDEFKKMDGMKRLELIDAAKESYELEFEKNGIKNLCLRKNDN